MENNFTLLPKEIIYHILNFLDQGEFVQCTMISKEIKNFILSTKRMLTVDGRSIKIIERFTNAKFSIRSRTSSELNSFSKIIFEYRERILALKWSAKEFFSTINIAHLTHLRNLIELDVPEITSTEKLLLLPKLKKLKIFASQNCGEFNKIFAKMGLEEFVVDFWAVVVTDKILGNYRQATEIFLKFDASYTFTGKSLLKFSRLKSLVYSLDSVNGKYFKNLNLTKLVLHNYAGKHSGNVTDRDIEHMTSLEYFDMKGFSITKSPSTKLTTLILNAMEFKSWETPKEKCHFLSSSLRPLTSLTNLTLSGSHIKGEDLKGLTNLRKLTLRGCERVELPDLAHLKNTEIVSN